MIKPEFFSTQKSHKWLFWILVWALFFLPNIFALDHGRLQAQQEIMDSSLKNDTEIEDIYEKDYRQSEQIKWLAAKNYWERDHDILSAIQEMDEFIILYPNGKYIKEAHLYLGKLYRINRDYEKALKLYESFYTSLPNQREGVEAKLEACRLHLLLGQKKRAAACFQVIIHEHNYHEDLHRLATSEYYLNFGLFPETKSPSEPKVNIPQVDQLNKKEQKNEQTDDFLTDDPSIKGSSKANNLPPIANPQQPWSPGVDFRGKQP